MTATTDIGEQSTNHLINLPNMIACESTEKQDITNPLELYNMTLEDDIECINYHSHEVAESDSGSEYFPSDSEDSDSDDDDSQTLPKQKKFIVFENELLKLFKFCQQCGIPTDATTTTQHGSMITVKISCMSGHTVTWESQPLVKGTAAGNLLIIVAIVFSGNTYKHTANFAKHLNLQFVSSSSYYRIQKKNYISSCSEGMEKKSSRSCKAVEAKQEC